MPRRTTANFGIGASGDIIRPIELFDIYLDNSIIRLASFNQNVNFFGVDSGDAQTYTAFPIWREPKKSSSDMAIDHVSVKAQNVDLAMSNYISSNDFRGRRMVIRKVFGNYLSASGDAVVIMDGLMDRPIIDEESVQVEVTNRSLGTLRNEAPRRWYQLLCNWKFAGTECATVIGTSALYDLKSGTVGAGSTTTHILDTNRTEGTGKTGNGYWVNGEFKITNGTYSGVKRTVTLSANGWMDLDFAYAGSVVGATYEIKRGCDKTLYRCSGDFSNQANYGGFPTIPEQEVIR